VASSGDLGQMSVLPQREQRTVCSSSVRVCAWGRGGVCMCVCVFVCSAPICVHRAALRGLNCMKLMLSFKTSCDTGLLSCPLHVGSVLMLRVLSRCGSLMLLQDFQLMPSGLYASCLEMS